MGELKSVTWVKIASAPTGGDHLGWHAAYVENEDIYYYITLLNENYSHPPSPEGAEQDILKGMYRLSAPAQPIEGKYVQLMGIRDHHRRQQRKHG